MSPASTALSWRRRLLDMVWQFAIRGGGILILAAVIAIVVFLVSEVFPLTRIAHVESVAERNAPATKAKLADGQLLVLRDAQLLHVAAEQNHQMTPIADVQQFWGNTATLVVHTTQDRIGLWQYTAAGWVQTQQYDLPAVFDRQQPLQWRGNRYLAQSHAGQLHVLDSVTGQIQSLNAMPQFWDIRDGRFWWLKDHQLYTRAWEGKPRAQEYNEDVQALVALAGGQSVVLISPQNMAQRFVASAAGEPPRLLQRKAVPEHHKVIANPAHRGLLLLSEDGVIHVLDWVADSLQRLPGFVGVQTIQVEPAGGHILLQFGDRVEVRRWFDPSPGVSYKSLWLKTSFEHYSEPINIWNSQPSGHVSSAKYGVSSLWWGSLKAALMALVIAVPLAILGAIYSTYFMRPGLRKVLKPIVELSESVPSVILGLIALMFVTPVMVDHLLPFLVLLFGTPMILALMRLVTAPIPSGVRYQWVAGRLPLFMLPLVLLAAMAAWYMGIWLEQAWFAGDFSAWLYTEYEIRVMPGNTLVVGLALGLVILPIIYALAEDAMASVPRSWVLGAQALGARPWQTLRRVIFPVAGPGVFSAILIGSARAFGETMIVLMVAGNTPLWGGNILEGLRSMASNLAIETPEATAGSLHFRILLLTALVLFAFTFLLNTLAETIRQELKAKVQQR